MIRAACTIASFNYLPLARTLYRSFNKFHPEYKFYVLLVDTFPDGFDPAKEEFELICVGDLDIPTFNSVAFKYGLVELNTNVKPTFLKYLLDRGIDQLIYFDPDILVCASVNLIYEALHASAIVLTPHCMSPNQGDPYAEQLLLSNGVFNLGFIAVANNEESQQFLSWWEHRCLTLGYSERWSGLFVDQKWINFVPCYFQSVHILKHPGCNVAYWNLHERQLKKDGPGWAVNGSSPLVFYHFSGVSIEGGKTISKHADQFDLVSRPELAELFEDYRARLVENSVGVNGHHAYGFGRFKNGEVINKLERAAFAANLERFGAADPFDVEGPFYRWAKQHRMRSHEDSAGKVGRKAYSSSDRRVRAINKLLRLALRLLGADRYAILMKYLEFISVLRNQKDVFSTR